MNRYSGAGTQLDLPAANSCQSTLIPADSSCLFYPHMKSSGGSVGESELRVEGEGEGQEAGKG
jgi:hypothetical protein